MSSCFPAGMLSHQVRGEARGDEVSSVSKSANEVSSVARLGDVTSAMGLNLF